MSLTTLYILCWLCHTTSTLAGVPYLTSSPHLALLSLFFPCKVHTVRSACSSTFTCCISRPETLFFQHITATFISFIAAYLYLWQQTSHSPLVFLLFNPFFTCFSKVWANIEY